MINKISLSKNEMDFLKEVMNIGAGNAATAISQILKSTVTLNIPAVYAVTLSTVSSILEAPAEPVVCVKMGMVGDIKGMIFLILSNRHKTAIVKAAERAIFGKTKKGSLDISALEEIGNILAGVYLASIHDFCKLNIIHTVPETRTDMFQAVMDEYLVAMGSRSENWLVVENEFSMVIESHLEVDRAGIRAFLLLIPDVDSVATLVGSIREAAPK